MKSFRECEAGDLCRPTEPLRENKKRTRTCIRVSFFVLFSACHQRTHLTAVTKYLPAPVPSETCTIFLCTLTVDSRRRSLWRNVARIGFLSGVRSHGRLHFEHSSRDGIGQGEGYFSGAAVQYYCTHSAWIFSSGCRQDKTEIRVLHVTRGVADLAERCLRAAKMTTVLRTAFFLTVSNS